MRAASLQTLQALSYLPFSAGVAWLVDHVLTAPQPRGVRSAMPAIAGYLDAPPEVVAREPGNLFEIS